MRNPQVFLCAWHRLRCNRKKTILNISYGQMQVWTSTDLQPAVRIKEDGGQFTCPRLPYAFENGDTSVIIMQDLCWHFLGGCRVKCN